MNLDKDHQIGAKTADPITEGTHEWVTPTKKGELDEEKETEEDELLANEESDAERQSEDSIKQSSSDEDSEEDDEAIQAQLQKEKDEEVRKMQEYAKANGFDITIDEKKPEPKYERYTVTKEMLDEQQKKDRERMIKEMYVPPPLEILRRNYTTHEPIRTGFNQGLLPINIRNNVEFKRAPCGPQIVITSQA